MKKNKTNSYSRLYMLSLLFGTDKFHNIMTGFCAIWGILWAAIYIICVFLRDSMISQAVSNMAMQGATEYSLVISSPMFTILKVMIWIMPVAGILWAVSTVLAEKKDHLLCEKKLLITTLVIIGISAVIAVADLAKIHMIFT
jgi:hypothetical protein